MALFILLLFTCTFISRFKCSEQPKINVAIIYPLEVIGGHLIRHVDDTLNLTCTVFPANNSRVREFKIEWYLPSPPGNSKPRVSIIQDRNRVTLVVEKLQENDSGDYKCRGVGNNSHFLLEDIVRVNVRPRKPHCGENMFHCPSTETCISRHYLCDGLRDCKDGKDEAEDNCGPDACVGKIKCENNRCIPRSWCCDDMDPNCTVKVRPKCCPKLTTGDMDDLGFPPSDQQQFNEMGFLQTTIYTVIGCAMAFMFIVTILVIAICRVHMKRSLLSRCPGRLPSRGPHHHHAMHHMPLYDLDVFLNRPDISPHPGLLVTYNINNGVQFVGRPVDPPPYCEVVASPPREGPPPPYASRESLTRVPAETHEDEEGPSEGDSLLGESRQVENDSPIIRQITVVNSASGARCLDYMDLYGIAEGWNTSSCRAGNQFSVVLSDSGSPVSNTSLSVTSNSSNETELPSCLPNFNVDANCTNNETVSEDTTENAVNISNFNECQPLLDETVTCSPKFQQPDVGNESLCASPSSPLQLQSKCIHVPNSQENDSFNVCGNCDNHNRHLRESFIGLHSDTSEASPENVKDNILPAAVDLLADFDERVESTYSQRT